MTAEDLAHLRSRRLAAIDALATVIAQLVTRGLAPIGEVARLSGSEVQLISTDSLVEYLTSKGLVDPAEYEAVVVDAIERRVATHRARLGAGAENFIDQLKKGGGL